MRYRIIAGPCLLHVMSAVMPLAVTMFSMVLTVMALAVLMFSMMAAMMALAMSMLSVMAAMMALALSVFSVMFAVGIRIKLKCARHKSFNGLVCLSAHSAVKHDTGLP